MSSRVFHYLATNKLKKMLVEKGEEKYTFVDFAQISPRAKTNHFFFSLFCGHLDNPHISYGNSRNEAVIAVNRVKNGIPWAWGYQFYRGTLYFAYPIFCFLYGIVGLIAWIILNLWLVGVWKFGWVLPNALLCRILRFYGLWCTFFLRFGGRLRLLWFGGMVYWILGLFSVFVFMT